MATVIKIKKSAAPPPPEGYAFRDRPLNDIELERLRLSLSTFRDGSGQNVLKKTGESMPGFRDYERSLAAVVGGTCPENKGIFDIEVETDTDPFGISCKMASAQPVANLCSFMELSNSAAKFHRHLESHHISWSRQPTLAGPALVELVASWHYDLAGEIDVTTSYYAVLLHDAKWRRFQLQAFPLDLMIVPPSGVEWLVEGASLNGYIDDNGRRHRLWQCYMQSGGQLKYYPLLRWKSWETPIFMLEAPDAVSPFEKAQRYFPDLWPE